mmetsp:Transcript_3511/g.7287  ORF Transcript_3511/g.7287 Transcript_3511/m.7287 type:complete len:127 (+) Transcript_3511:1151-1531(+)
MGALWRLLVLLVIFALGFEVSPEMQELMDKHAKMMDRMRAVRDTAVTNEEGLCTAQEYGRILKGVMMAASGAQGEKHLTSLVDQYVATLPEFMDPTKIMEDIGMGAFGELMRSRLTDNLIRPHEEL